MLLVYTKIVSPVLLKPPVSCWYFGRSQLWYERKVEAGDRDRGGGSLGPTDALRRNKKELLPTWVTQSLKHCLQHPTKQKTQFISHIIASVFLITFGSSGWLLSGQSQVSHSLVPLQRKERGSLASIYCLACGPASYKKETSIEICGEGREILHTMGSLCHWPALMILMILPC